MRHGRCAPWPPPPRWFVVWCEVCPPGFLGTDCSVRDVQASRQERHAAQVTGCEWSFARTSLLAFGIHSKSSSCRLVTAPRPGQRPPKVGVPLSQSSLDSWPVRPRLLSGPSLLTFRAEPDLPRGLRLEQGELEGLPLVPAPRRAYVCLGS